MSQSITKYMTQKDLTEQLIMLSKVNIERVNYREFLEMFNKWEKPLYYFRKKRIINNEILYEEKTLGFYDENDEVYKLIKKRLDELEYYYK